MISRRKHGAAVADAFRKGLKSAVTEHAERVHNILASRDEAWMRAEERIVNLNLALEDNLALEARINACLDMLANVGPKTTTVSVKRVREALGG